MNGSLQMHPFYNHDQKRTQKSWQMLKRTKLQEQAYKSHKTQLT
jgi:hypothetical protein